jgi:hypothetical protein
MLVASIFFIFHTLLILFALVVLVALIALVALVALVACVSSHCCICMNCLISFRCWLCIGSSRSRICSKLMVVVCFRICAVDFRCAGAKSYCICEFSKMNIKEFSYPCIFSFIADTCQNKLVLCCMFLIT